MYRDGRWKLVTYHGKGIDELYDLQEDPWEHRDLSPDPGAAEIKARLLRQSFDATVRAIPPQEPRVAPY
jgi:arylsulfatase A-like enzyme